jgi:hypothetical protein
MKNKLISNKKKENEFKKRMAHRQKKVQYVFNACPPAETLLMSPDPSKLPIGQLFSACRQFVMECCENAILNSAFAVEYALLFKICSDKAVDKDALAKEYKGSFDLRYALQVARKNNWIDQPLFDELQLMNNLRDMSSHPSNWISVYKLLSNSSLDEIKRWVSKSASKSEKQIAENLGKNFNVTKANQTVNSIASYGNARWGNLPDLEWASKKGTLEFQKNYVKKYCQTMVHDLINNNKIRVITENPESAPEYIMTHYPFQDDTALYAIDMAYRTLKRLKVI